MKVFQLTLVALFLMVSVSAPALAKRERVPVDSALNDSFKERDQVQRSYKKSDSARRERPAQGGGRIRIEVGDEFGGGMGRGGGGDESLNFRDNRRTDDAERVNVDKEMNDIKASVKTDMDRNPQAYIDEDAE